MRLKVLLAGILTFHAGWYMLVPFFAILFTTRRGLSPAEVGLVLAAQSFLLLLGSLLGGALADRYGRRLTMVLGLAFRAAGLALLGFASTLPGALVGAAVAGVGGGLYGPAAKAAIAVLAADGPDRTTIFGWRGIAANIGTSSGPLLGSLLVRGPMPVLFGSSAVVHVGLGVVTWLLLPAEGGAVESSEAKAPWRDLLRDYPYLAFSVVTALSWALFSQLMLAVPLYASRVLGLEASIGLLWTTSSLVVIAAQVPVSKYLLSQLSPAVAMAAGVALLGAGLGLVGPARSFAGLLGAVMLFVVGEMLLLPTVDSAVSLMAPAAAVGSYFGMASFAWGLGEGVGNLAGGGLMQYALGRGQLGLPWVIYAVVGVAIGGLFLALGRWVGARGAERGVATAAGAAAGATPAEGAATAGAPATGAATARKIGVYRPGHPAPDEDRLLLGGSLPDDE
ncbi:MAG TPA: MFS transporter [Symbiobacteriaceae bacterium]|nr:MFS transporter [Symbiobacteriaceae bacterium]